METAPIDLKARFATVEKALALPINRGHRQAVLDVVGQDFAEECPLLFKMLNEPRSHPRLRSMLSMAVSVDKGDTSQYDASVEVGQTLVDDFVKGKMRR